MYKLNKLNVTIEKTEIGHRSYSTTDNINDIPGVILTPFDLIFSDTPQIFGHDKDTVQVFINSHPVTPNIIKLKKGDSIRIIYRFQIGSENSNDLISSETITTITVS